MNRPDIDAARSALLKGYASGVAAVAGETVTEAWLNAHPPAHEVAVIALGKAAAAMAMGAQRALGGHLSRGLVLTKTGHAESVRLDERRFIVREGAHPIPDAHSLAAGDALLAFIDELPGDQPVVVLISGGASALVELLRPGVTLEDLARVNGWLLANGRPIDEINAVRRRLSRLKGGGLATLLAPRPVTGLLISDVEGDDPAVIGSGPLLVPSSAALPDGLPGWMEALLPEAQDPEVADADVEVIATLDQALAAAEQALRGQGFEVRRYPEHLLGDLSDVSGTVIEAMRREPGCVHLWGGEATLMLPENPGRGGRNQHLALDLATRLTDWKTAVALCAGTDGSDGPTDDAGGLVDQRTVERGDLEGLAAHDFLARADAGSFLAQTGDLVSTGPTGTNVCDLVIAWRA